MAKKRFIGGKTENKPGEIKYSGLNKYIAVKKVKPAE